MTAPIKAAVLTGLHGYDVIGFHRLLRRMEGHEVEFYPQSLEDFVNSGSDVQKQYQVLVFFNFHDGDFPQEIRLLLESGVGAVVLHHGFVTWKNDTWWRSFIALPFRDFEFAHDEKVTVNIADRTHPITWGLEDFCLIDEVYSLWDADLSAHILLRTNRPGYMETLGWVKESGAMRMFCLMPGHDHQAWENANFQTVLKRGVQWSAHCL